MATIRKRMGKWQAQVRRKGKIVSRTFIQRRDAVRWSNQTELVLDRGGLQADLRDLERLTVSDLLTRFRDTVVPMRRGAKKESIMLNAFLRHEIANTRLSEIGANQFASYRDERLKTVKAATINREFGLLQHAFETARKEWATPLPENPLSA